MSDVTVYQPNNAEIYRSSTDAAGLCREIVLKTAMEIQGRKYVRVEGWQAIAIAHGCTGSARDVETVDGGVRAIGEIRRMNDGAIIAQAEGFVGEDEPTWYGGETQTKWGKKVLPKRPDYAIRAMAQTRAISRACRSAFAHVVVLIDANLSTTPAEEVPHGGFDDMRDVTPRDETRTAPAPPGAPLDGRGKPILPDEYGRYNANQCKTITTTRPDTGEVITKHALAGGLGHEMTSIMDVTELLAWRRVWEPEIATWPKSWSDKFWENYDLHLEDLRGLAVATHGDADFRGEGDEGLAGDDDFPGDRPATGIVRGQLRDSVEALRAGAA